WAFKISLGRSKPMVITKARTLNDGSHSFLLKALATTFAFLGDNEYRGHNHCATPTIGVVSCSVPSNRECVVISCDQ
nr:hypothetical protein [Tanacetum cinerariifolium]